MAHSELHLFTVEEMAREKGHSARSTEAARTRRVPWKARWPAWSAVTRHRFAEATRRRRSCWRLKPC